MALARFLPSSVRLWGGRAVLLAALFFSYQAYAKDKPRFQCAKYGDQLVAALHAKYSINSIGVAHEGFAVQLFIDRSGNWLMLGIDDNLNACKIMQGTDWAWMAMGEL